MKSVAILLLLLLFKERIVGFGVKFRALSTARIEIDASAAKEAASFSSFSSLSFFLLEQLGVGKKKKKKKKKKKSIVRCQMSCRVE